MKKYICDKCNKELTEKKYNFCGYVDDVKDRFVGQDETEDIDIDLCKECYLKLKALIF